MERFRQLFAIFAMALVFLLFGLLPTFVEAADDVALPLQAASEEYCIEKPVDIEFLTRQDDTVNGTAGWHVFFRADTQLGNLEPNQYYFYYRDEYVGPEALVLEGFNAERDQWQAQISATWIAGMQNDWGVPNPFKSKYRFWMKKSWRVDYAC